jgi:hypothetical protein
MANTITLRSPDQILGELVRELLVSTDISTIAAGSDVMTLLEAIAQSQFEIEVSALKILENSALESLVGSSLDKKAEAIRLPNTIGGYGRKPASQAIGPVIIGSSFKKISSKLYAGKPAPFSGSSILYLEKADSFPPTGQIYIGRGTIDRFEGPIAYSSLVNSGSFWTMTLSTSLTKNHLQSDLVVYAQGGDRIVPAGTVVQVPANSETPAVSFTTVSDILIPDGEAEGTVNVACTQFGGVGNALAGSIKVFLNAPFPGATVTNDTSFRSGKNTESDEDLRQRIKAYPSTLSRGTRSAILAAIQGATDSTSGRTIQSAVILEPVEPGDVARVYIDDNTGLEPSFGKQPYEILIQNAAGQETRFRTAQFPITPATIEGANFGPFSLTNGLTLTVHVDEVVETYSITPSNYTNLISATAYEIARDLNSQSNIVGFRTIDNGTRLVMTDLSGTAEVMYVTAGNLQEILGIPLAVVRPIFVYKNSELLSFRGKTATLETRTKNSWNLSALDMTDVRVNVDGVIQEFSVSNTDFLPYGTTISSATINQWAEVLSTKLAGVKFTVSGSVLVWSSWQDFSSGGYLEILETKADGSPAGWINDVTGMWTSAASGGKLSDRGSSKDYKFNRFTGEINLLSKPAAGDIIEVGLRATRAHINSIKTTSGLVSLAPSLTTVGNSRFVVAFDGEFALRSVAVPAGSQFTPTEPDPTNAKHVIRATVNVPDVFLHAKTNDWLYLIKDVSAVPGWGANVEGFYRIKRKGNGLYSTNQVFNTLSASTQLFSGVTASVTKDLNIVKVTSTSHGLKTGDLITVTTTTAIGGISSANLSVTDAPIIVLSPNTYQYTALATATSTTGGTLDSIGTNIVTVTQTAHGFSTGAEISVTTAAAIGGISGANLSVTSAAIEVISTNIYKFRALAAATSSASGTLTTVTYLADTWVEFEVSAVQYADWSPLLGIPQDLTLFMVNVFLSTATPQLVDFGNAVSAVSIDQIVSMINDNIAGGTAVKLSPQQFQIRTNNFQDGTVAVLAVVGNAKAMLEAAIDTSIQSHTGNSISGYTQGGFPVVQSVSLPTSASSGYPTRTYLSVDKTFVDVLDTLPDPTINAPSFVTSYPEGFQHLWLTGRQSGIVGRVYNNQTTAPFTGILRGGDVIRALGTSDTEQTSASNLNRYSNYGLRLRDIPLNNHDRLVVEMDLNATDRTVAISMAKLAKILDIDAITGSGMGQVISFRLKDPEDSDKAFFDSTSVYKDFDFRDFNILTKSVGLYREDVSDRALILRSVEYGAAARLRLSIRLPEAPNLADFSITHLNNFSGNEGCLNLIVTLPSQTLIAGSGVTSGSYKVTATASGTLYDWRISAPSINSGSEYVAGNVLNIAGSNLAGSYEIIASTYGSYTAVTAAVTNGSPTVTVTQPSHGYQTGDLVTISASSAIGGISAIDLSQAATEITVLNANTFTYVAGASATSSINGSLNSITGGSVTIKAPGSGGLAPSAMYDAGTAPIKSWALLPKTLADLATAITAYYPNAPVATGEAIGTNILTSPIAHPTYIVYPASSAYTGSDMSGAFNHHSFSTKFSGGASIWQYDSSNPLLNNIKATVQTVESIFPTTTDALGTTYTPINEEVLIVPSNTKTLASWLAFKASSSLNILAAIERVNGDNSISLASREDGSNGAVNVTGVAANSVVSAVIGNGSTDGDASKVTILNADARSIMRNSVVRVTNSIASEILRAYRNMPTGASITSANTTNINNYFRATNSLKYIRVNANSGRLIFLRNGQGISQTEPLDDGNIITLTSLGGGLVQVTSAIGSGVVGSGKLSARVGDMMYVQPTSPFPIDVKCKPIPATGRTDSSNPEYLGYPVVHVIDDSNIVIIAPNITSFGATVLADTAAVGSRELVFLPAVWNEKNIRTNHAEGAKFDALVNNNKAYYLVKTLGGGMMSVWLQNSSAESTDTMLLDTMSVSTDDYAVFGNGFDPANQGIMRIVAHNGRNHLIVHNPNGGKDELVDPTNGDRIWRVGPLEDGVGRQLRIISGDSVKIGDLLRISTPSDSAQWFNSSFFGSFKITGIGLQAIDYTGASLPHTTASGTYDNNEVCPFIDFDFVSAPVAVTDSSNNPVSQFVVGNNASSIGFTEGTPFSVFRLVAGQAVDPQNAENSTLFLVPKINTQKISASFGTSIASINKIGFNEQTYIGIDGYKTHAGPVQLAHRIIDGLPQNTVLYPGVKAAGAVVEVQTPLIKSISISLSVSPKDGVTLNSISDLVKASIADYVNSLGVGKDVVLSEIIRVVQSLPGVFSVQVLSTLPVADDGKIVVADQEKAFILSITKDISIG